MQHSPRRALCLLLAACLAAAGCGSGDSPDNGPTSPGRDALSGTISIKIHSDQPGWSLLTPPATYSGFDYDLGNWLAHEQDFQPSYSTVVSAAREREITGSDGRMLVIATYSITDARRKLIGMAGPYMRTQQGIMVRRGDTSIRSSRDLVGKIVCTAGGTTSAEQLKNLGAKVTEREGFTQCRDELENKRVQAVSTDQLILYGFANNDPALAVVPDVTFGNAEQYGIGFRKGDLDMCRELTEAIKKFIVSGTWDTYYTNQRLPEKLRASSRPDPNRLDDCG